MDLPKILPDALESLSRIALRAVCYAYGSPQLADNVSIKTMLDFVRSAAQDPHTLPGMAIEKRFVLRLRGLSAAQMLEQQMIHSDIEEKQQRMAAEAAIMAAAVAAVEADGYDDADDTDDADDDDSPSFEHLSPGT
jgi:hypothetical protein